MFNTEFFVYQHKKLTKFDEEKCIQSPKPEMNSEANDIDIDISNAIKNGILYIEDAVEKV